MLAIILICAITNPADCREIKVPTDAIGVIDCQKSAHPIAADWMNKNPRYRVQRVTCTVDPDTVALYTLR